MPTEPPFLPRSMLFVITRGDSIGGAQIHVRDLCRRLAFEGVRVGVAAGTGGALQDELGPSIPYFLVPSLKRSINPLSDVFAMAELGRVLRAFQPQLVSTHTAKAGFVGRVAAFWHGVPSLFTAHGWQFAEGISWWQKILVLALETVLARLSRRIICVSAYDRSLALKARLGGPRKIVLVHNGMPWREAPEQRSSMTTASTKPVSLIMTARFQPQKDHETLLTALKMLESHPWTLQLVGDGPLLELVRRRVHDLGWDNRVTFAGQVMDVPQRLEASDVFILASLWEGFPRSILEAMRAQLPVVCSEVGGVREAVLEGVTGKIVPPQDPQALAQALQPLLEDLALRQKMGKAGRACYEAEFTFDAMLAKTRQVWEQALRKGKPR